MADTHISDLIAREPFAGQVNYAALPSPALIALFGQAKEAHANFCQCW